MKVPSPVSLSDLQDHFTYCRPLQMQFLPHSWNTFSSLLQIEMTNLQIVIVCGRINQVFDWNQALHVPSATAEPVEPFHVAISEITTFSIKKMPASNCYLKWRCMCCIVLRCDVCQKPFVRPCLLRNHVRLVHPPDDTVEVYNCTESGCSRTYASIRSLKRHIVLVHEGQGTECPQCLRTLSTKVSATQSHAFCPHHYEEIFNGNFALLFGVVAAL